MSCGAGHRHGSVPTLLWLWHRPADVAQIQPLASWELYAMGMALKSRKKKKKKKERNKQTLLYWYFFYLIWSWIN